MSQKWLHTAFIFEGQVTVKVYFIGFKMQKSKVSKLHSLFKLHINNYQSDRQNCILVHSRIIITQT